LAPVIPLLVSAGASTELPNPPNDGLTPLGLAIQYAKDDLVVVRALVEAGAQLNWRRRPTLSAPVHEASTLEQACFLIEHGARWKMPDGDGRRKLVSLFDRGDDAQQGLLDDAIEGWARKPILLTKAPIKLPPTGAQAQALTSCQICSDEFVAPTPNNSGHKRRREYCRLCGLTVCASCSSHKLAFPLHKSGQRTTKAPPVLPQTSAAGGQSTFAAPPPLDPEREVAAVCDGCYNVSYARSTRLRKDRRKRRKARQTARAAAEGDDLAQPVSDEHDSEKEAGAEGAVYDGVEASHHAANVTAALQREGIGGDKGIGGAIGGVVVGAAGAVVGAAENVLALVGVGGKSRQNGGGVPEDSGGTFSAQASRAFDKLSNMFTAVHVSQAPPSSASRSRHARNASQASSTPDGPAMATIAGSSEDERRHAQMRAAVAAASPGRASPMNRSPMMRPFNPVSSLPVASLGGGGGASGSSRDSSQPATPTRSRQGSDIEEEPRGRSSRARASGAPAAALPPTSGKRKAKKDRRDDGDE
jgi:hypothetical protein